MPFEISVVPDNVLRASSHSSLNRLPWTFDWEIWGGFSDIVNDLRDTHGLHRKSWEYATCIQGLRQLCQLDDTSSLLATGAGSERPLYYYANHCKEIFATDLYDQTHPEGDPSMLTEPFRFAPFPYVQERLKVERMSALDLRFDDQSFDAEFCLSSIEHFGTRDDQRRAFAEMERTLKIGGVACIVTELILNDTTHSEYFTIEELEYVFFNNSNMKLVGGDMDLRVQKSLLDYPCDLRNMEGQNKSPHIVVTDGSIVWTSLSMFFQKTGA